MKKILIAFDGNHFSEAAFNFVRHLNEKEDVLVIGVFLPVVDYAELLYSLGGLSGPMYLENVAYEDTDIIQKNIDRFKLLCADNQIEYRVHPDIEKHVISEIKIESRYADLLVIDSELFYNNLNKEIQADYIENTLHKSECPVFLVPGHYQLPQNIILAYDGSEHSVYAIKQFAYLFPEWTNLNTLLVHAGTKDISDSGLLEELAAHHYNNLHTYHLNMEPHKYFNAWLEEQGNSILVTGAYERSALSEMLKKSFISETIQDYRIPIFIGHRN